jgi:hypothetical protein
MLKLLIFFCFILSSLSVFASEVQMITMKERLRISLWVDGIDQKSEVAVKKDSKNRLPIELESALRKL